MTFELHHGLPRPVPLGGAPPSSYGGWLPRLVATIEVCLVVGVAVLLPLVVLLAGALTGSSRAARSAPGEDPWLLSLLLIFQALVFVNVGVVARRLRCGKPPGRLSLGARFFLGFVFAALAMVGSIVLSLILAALGAPAVEQAWLVNLAEERGPGAMLVILLAVIVAPVAEEILFRGYAFERLRQAGGPVLAYAVSSLLFALIHGNPSALVLYLFLGLVLARAYHASGSVLTAFVAHALNNAAAFSLLLMATG